MLTVFTEEQEITEVVTCHFTNKNSFDSFCCTNNKMFLMLFVVGSVLTVFL